MNPDYLSVLLEREIEREQRTYLHEAAEYMDGFEAYLKCVFLNVLNYYRDFCTTQ